MKKLLAGIVLFLCTVQVKAQSINEIINAAASAVNASSLSNTDIAAGLKEALNVGTNKATEQSAKVDGFYKNPLIKIPYPSETKDMMSTLKKVGMSKQVKEFEKQLNRAAEDAAKKAAPIFLD